MEHPALIKMTELSRREDAIENTIQYLTEHLQFLKPREVVLICFSRQNPESLGCVLEQAVLRCGAVPVMLEGDWKWKAILRKAFDNRATTMISPPLVALGLAKIAKYKQTPLSIRRVVTAGYPCLEWMIDGIVKGYDCETYRIFTPGGRLVSGFSCKYSKGTHLRGDVYDAEMVDLEGKPLPDGADGHTVVWAKEDPGQRYLMAELGKRITEPCKCGCKEPRLVDMRPDDTCEPDLIALGQYLQSWSSILDCRLKKSNYGLEIELVAFPGEKLPKLPSAAKLLVRAWNPDKDEPFFYAPGMHTFDFVKKN